jgi:hypothetical protein
MEILNLVNDEPEVEDSKSDFLNSRKVQSRTSLSDKLLSAKAKPAAIDTLIHGLVELLPPPESVWPLDDRAKWLRVAAGIFELGYKPGDAERMDINIVLVNERL